MHLGLLSRSPRSLVPITMYLAWMLLSGLVAITFWLRNQRADAALDRRRLLRGEKVRRPRVEGLGWFAVSVAAGLVMHALNAFVASGPYTQQRGMWLVFFILAVSCSHQLRGPVGDSNAPIPDGSPVARAGSVLRRLAGVALACVGVGLFYVGTASAATPGDGFDLVIRLFFKASGVILVLIGLALALLPRRDDR